MKSEGPNQKPLTIKPYPMKIHGNIVNNRFNTKTIFLHFFQIKCYQNTLLIYLNVTTLIISAESFKSNNAANVCINSFLPSTALQNFTVIIQYEKNCYRITGASGSIYAKELVAKTCQFCKEQWNELAIVMTDNANKYGKQNWMIDPMNNYPVKFYTVQDFMAPFASGSGKYDTMIIIPCSMGTLGRIASGISNDLITRAADVILKERRKLICVVRDTPYNLIHIRNMETVTLAGGIICPATPSFYSKPKTIEEVAATVVDRVLDLAGSILQLSDGEINNIFLARYCN